MVHETFDEIPSDGYVVNEISLGAAYDLSISRTDGWTILIALGSYKNELRRRVRGELNPDRSVYWRQVLGEVMSLQESITNILTSGRD